MERILSRFVHSDIEGALSRALLVGDFETAVDICIGADRMVSSVYRPCCARGSVLISGVS